MSIFGERLKKLRLERNLVQKEVGAWIHVSDSSIRKYESGDRTPTPEVIATLAERFGVTTDYLLGADEGAGYYNNPETAELADRLKNQEGMRILFDASRNAKPEDLKMVAGILNRLKGEQ